MFSCTYISTGGGFRLPSGLARDVKNTKEPDFVRRQRQKRGTLKPNQFFSLPPTQPKVAQRKIIPSNAAGRAARAIGGVLISFMFSIFINSPFFINWIPPTRVSLFVFVGQISDCYSLAVGHRWDTPVVCHGSSFLSSQPQSGVWFTFSLCLVGFCQGLLRPGQTTSTTPTIIWQIFINCEKIEFCSPPCPGLLRFSYFARENTNSKRWWERGKGKVFGLGVSVSSHKSWSWLVGKLFQKGNHVSFLRIFPRARSSR